MIDRGGLNLLFANLKELEDLYKAQETKSKVQEKPVAPVEELTDTYTKMAAENEPMTFTENIDKPQVNQEFLADAPSFMELIPKEERLDESKFQQKVVLDTDGVYRLKTFPIEENVKTNVDILKEQIGVEQGLLEKPVEDFGGINLGIQGAKQRELDDTIADKVLTESEVKDMKQAEKMIQDIEREKQKSEEEQPKAETTGTTYTASSLYDGLKSKDEKIFNNTANYLYDAISKYEWRGQKPIFDFVGVEQGSDVRSSAFGPAQIVSDTVRNELERIAKKYGKDSEEYIFADKLQAAQNLFLNLSDKYRKGKKINEQTAKEVATTKAAIDEDYKFGGAAFKKLGIDKEKFVDYVKEGYFLPSNHPVSKKRKEDGLPTGIPLELLGDNYKANYMKLFKSVLSNKAAGKTKSLEKTIQNYHGDTDEEANKIYQEGVFKNLNLPITQEKE